MENGERMNGNIKGDSRIAQIEVIRLMIYLITTEGFRLRCVDVKCDYIQSGTIKCELYVGQPRDFGLRRDQM